MTEERIVDVAIDIKSGLPAIGGQAEVYIATRVRPHALSVPAKALTSGKGGRGVWVIKDGRVRFQAVKTGISDPSGWVEIESGLQPGEKVAAAPLPIMVKFEENARIVVTKNVPRS